MTCTKRFDHPQVHESSAPDEGELLLPLDGDTVLHAILPGKHLEHAKLSQSAKATRPGDSTTHRSHCFSDDIDTSIRLWDVSAAQLDQSPELTASIRFCWNSAFFLVSKLGKGKVTMMVNMPTNAPAAVSQGPDL
jgi:hypothetical protein